MVRRAKRTISRGQGTDSDDVQSTPERAVESLTELAAASGAQAMRLAAAVARGMAKGVASAARQMQRPVGEMTEAATETVRIVRDSASRGVERASRRTRRATAGRSRRGTRRSA